MQSNRNIIKKKIGHCHCYQEDGLAAKQEESYLKKSVIAHCYQEDGIAAKQQEFYLKKSLSLLHISTLQFAQSIISVCYNNHSLHKQ